MWLQLLRRWLERKESLSKEQCEAEFRAERERHELEVRKAEALRWYLPPPC